MNKNLFNMAWWRSSLTAIPCSFWKKWPNYASGRKSVPNSDSFWVLRFLNICVRVFCAPKCGVSLPKSVRNLRTHSATLPWFLKQCRNISQRCSSIYATIFVQRRDKTNYLSNQIWVNFYHSRNKNLWKKNFSTGSKSN